MPGNMSGRKGRDPDAKLCPVRIHPGMKRHSAYMRFCYHKFQWGHNKEPGLPLFASKPFAPGFILRRVKGVCSRTYLYNHCIDTIALVQVQ